MACRLQAIIWTIAGILLIGPVGTHFNEILIKIHTFSFKKMSSGKRRPLCLGLNALIFISGGGGGGGGVIINGQLTNVYDWVTATPHDSYVVLLAVIKLSLNIREMEYVILQIINKKHHQFGRRTKN